MTCSCLDGTDCSLYFQNLKVVREVVHGPGPKGWFMDQCPCLVYISCFNKSQPENLEYRLEYLEDTLKKSQTYWNFTFISLCLPKNFP